MFFILLYCYPCEIACKKSPLYTLMTIKSNEKKNVLHEPDMFLIWKDILVQQYLIEDLRQRLYILSYGMKKNYIFAVVYDVYLVINLYAFLVPICNHVCVCWPFLCCMHVSALAKFCNNNVIIATLRYIYGFKSQAAKRYLTLNLALC